MIPICFCKPKRTPCPKCSTYDYSKSRKLIPNGDAAKDKILSERLQPSTEPRC